MKRVVENIVIMFRVAIAGQWIRITQAVSCIYLQTYYCNFAKIIISIKSYGVSCMFCKNCLGVRGQGLVEVRNAQVIPGPVLNEGGNRHSSPANLETIKSPNLLLKEAVANADSVAIKPLIERGANPNLKDSKGWTALHYACYLGINDKISKVQNKRSKRMYLLIISSTCMFFR